MMEKKSEQELVHIVEIMGDYDEVAGVLIELKNRKSDKFFSIAYGIIRDQLGDTYLQATAFELLYDADFNGALSLLREKINVLDDNIITSAMDCLSADSEVIDLEIVRDIVQKLLQKCDNIRIDDTPLGEGLKRSIEWFKRSYEPKLQKNS